MNRLLVMFSRGTPSLTLRVSWCVVAALALAGVARAQGQAPPIHISLHPQGSSTGSAGSSAPGYGQPDAGAVQPVQPSATYPSQGGYSSAQPTYSPQPSPGYTQPALQPQPGGGGAASGGPPAYVPPPMYIPSAGVGVAPDGASVSSGVDTAPAPSTPTGSGGVKLLTPETAYGGRDFSTATVGHSQSSTSARSASTVAKRKVVVSRKRALPVIVKPPEPMLDETGRQYIGPDGKAMFYPAIMQLRDKHGKPVVDHGEPVFQTKDNLGYDERGREIHPPKPLPVPKNASVLIEHGTLAMDGIVGKLQLNYDIPELQYLYLYVPEIGVAVVSDRPFLGAQVQRNAFKGDTVSVYVDKHLLQVSSDKALLSGRPKAAYVSVNRSYTLPSTFPVFGFGSIRVAPYAWPASKVDSLADKVAKQAPPILKQMKPKLACTADAPCEEDRDRSLREVAPPTTPVVPVEGATPVGAEAAVTPAP